MGEDYLNTQDHQSSAAWLHVLSEVGGNRFMPPKAC